MISESGAVDFYQARRDFLSNLHTRMQLAGTRVVVPVLVGLYALNAFRYPCWQTKVLFVGAAAMGAAYLYGFALARRGLVDRAVLAICTSSLSIFFLAAILLSGAGVSTSIALIALLTYVALFSQRSLFLVAGAGGLGLILAAVINHSGLVPQFVPAPREQLLSEIAFVVVFASISAFFLREGQLISENLFHDMERTNRGQHEVLETIGRIAPDISVAVDDIKRASETVSTHAGEQAITSRNLYLATEEMAGMVGSSAQAAEETSSISEKTRDDSLASRERLDRVEARFQDAVARIDSVRESIGHLASQLARTAEINQAIRDIAESLKVLAVNTSLEAAKAGEHGRGFAVVAKELQRLIGKTSEDLRHSRQLLQELREEAEKIAADSEAGTEALRGTFDELRETGGLIQGITDSFLVTSSKVDEIAGAAEQERVRINEISAAMQDFETGSEGLSTAANALGLGIERIDHAQSELRRILGARSSAEPGAEPGETSAAA